MLPYFACGRLVRALIEERRLPHAAGTWALALAGLALVAADALWHETSDVGFLERTLRDLPAAAGFALVLAAIRLSPAVARPLGREPLAHLGLVSYGVYLWHVPLMLALRSWGLLPLSFLPGLAVALFAAVAVASVSWVVLERPVLNRVRAGDVARA
jgi:peptidoglycan/LPS O-acetylase OafA/YrhL